MANSRFYHVLARSSAVGALLLASQAYAQVQNPGADRVDDAPDSIVVTARKQSETVTDVPATVNVVSPEALSGRRINTGLDLSGIVPGFQVVTGLAGSAEPRIRGLGSVTAVFSIEASVASFIDGIYAAHPRDYVSPSFDLERIEVIKGTQSTTLGKNATLGAISFVSRRPGRDLGFEVSASQEFKFDSSRFEGAIDIPLGETLHARDRPTTSMSTRSIPIPGSCRATPRSANRSSFRRVDGSRGKRKTGALSARRSGRVR
ncbi:TonB-dependent receptor plug domain-containing protein [Sphingomonas sp. SRS2]|uniref:TonB-dependent receptor plug domain-containing protein n=1 Tax=Sphingomonas sp. SRS2 TaxID=133190 RepID=UPI0006184040|nr:TonB-dependent receptor plug domain-containing protein [Sphingomonas sp. SRS2]KKC27659.1 hypothetical protein WP12_01970 [Sphingomonas sp. SRS2]